MKIKFYLSLVLFLAGLFFLINTKTSITGDVIGVSQVSSSITGIILIAISGVLFVIKREEESELERKLGKIKNVKIRRELLSDARGAEQFAEKGYDVNRLWDENKSYEENKKHFLEKFYSSLSKDILDGYMKYRRREAKRDFKFEELLKEKISGKFKRFKEKALRMIVLWNDKISSRKFVPLYIIESKEKPRDYPDKKMRMVYYGPENLKGKSKSFYQKARKEGRIIATHEIVNPKAITHPEKLSQSPHIHWELEYIMDKEYEFK